MQLITYKLLISVSVLPLFYITETHSGCAGAMCKCDRAFALCINQVWGSYNEKYKDYQDSKFCKETAAQIKEEATKEAVSKAKENVKGEKEKSPTAAQDKAKTEIVDSKVKEVIKNEKAKLQTAIQNEKAKTETVDTEANKNDEDKKGNLPQLQKPKMLN